MPPEFTELAGHDAYELLGVSPNATQHEIRRAYRTLAKSSHPDLFPDPQAKADANERIRLLNAARQILDSRRAAYDASRCTPGKDEPPATETIDDPWDTAKPGPAPDPWRRANLGRYRSPHPPPPRHRPPPTYRPMSPPPRHGYPPGPRLRAQPARAHRRRSTVVKIVVKIAVAYGVTCILLWFVSLVSFVVSAVSPTTAKPSAPVPTSFAGTWKGTVRDRGKAGDKNSGWQVELTLHTGKHNGEVRYLGGKCTGTAVPASYKTGRLTVKTEFPEKSAGCNVGDMQLTRSKNGKLNVTYHDDHGKVSSTGSLSRTR